MKACSHESEALQWVPLTTPSAALQSRCGEHKNDLSTCTRGFEFEKIKYWCGGGASFWAALAPRYTATPPVSCLMDTITIMTKPGD